MIHGTPAAYLDHHRSGTPYCRICLDASRQADEQYHAARWAMLEHWPGTRDTLNAQATVAATQ